MGRRIGHGARGFPAHPVHCFGLGGPDAGESDRALLGGKGAGLAEMSRLGIPVPPGFTLSTEVCGYYYRNRSQYPGPLVESVEAALRSLEERMERRFGDPELPLLVSVRSGAPLSMPGLMDTILNVGLGQKTLAGLARGAGGMRFALDCFRRLLEMYGDVVRGVDHGRFAAALVETKARARVERDQELGDSALEKLVERYLDIFRDATGEPFPEDARAQLWGAIDAVFASWMSPRAVIYRRIHGISNALGTAVNVQAMVFGNAGPGSATGVCFTRDPATGDARFFGEFLPNAQGEDVVAGLRTPQPMRRDEGSTLPSFEECFPESYRELETVRDRLERRFGDMQDIEFTVEDGRLYILQTRRGERTGPAALRIACDMLDEGSITREQAVAQVHPEGLAQVLAPAFRPEELEARDGACIATGLAASPGAACGRIALAADRAAQMAAAGLGPVVLVRTETSPEDIAGMEVASGILTTRGGKTSHAAVVARGMGKPCVVACEALAIDEERGCIRAGAILLHEGDAISIDGGTGRVYRGALAVEEPEILRALGGALAEERSPSFQRFRRFLSLADGVRRLGVRANADTPADARVARLLGAEGIGLCRTEHMFFGEERILRFRRMILAGDRGERERWLGELLPYQREDFLGIFRAMDGLPVTIRLLDPPLHEFLPHDSEEIERFAAEAALPVERVRARVEETREANPMLGLRGCRLGIVHPEITEMQYRAIFEAALAAEAEGVRAVAEIMIPLVGLASEVERMRELLDGVLARLTAERPGTPLAVPFQFGTMIEVPRAALVARQLGEQLDFFSFGTNDLTQMTLGLSRDDSAPMLKKYIEEGLLPADPFASIDADGVGALMEMGLARGRAGNPKLKVGICGEHGGDPRSVALCHRLGLDYVSCSPYRVPVARLAAAQAAIAG